MAFGIVLCNYDSMPTSGESAFTASALLINIAALAVLILFGCHNPFMFNQSTLVLGYLLLYGYDVSGKSYMLRIAGMAAGAAITCLVFYRNHKNRDYKRNMKAVIEEFDLSSSRTKWQLCQILCVPLVLCIAQLCNMPRAMWAGIAAMSAILPFMEDMQYRVKKGLSVILPGYMLYGIILPASAINLCVHRNHRWNRRGIIGTIRLAGCF